ncbi:hypothetical protein [Zoogloea sp.]|uniref:hypothetical protein n=1 Tax=Zoogloea sp. TaxID=49181 RepID=UPI001AC374CC|nr:hypothetical protein [Zoogloea sp.]MBN8282118.1 hypothetical protein [Zoogloea sp.]
MKASAGQKFFFVGYAAYFSLLLIFLLFFLDKYYPYPYIENSFSLFRIIFAALVLSVQSAFILTAAKADSPVECILHMFMVLMIVPNAAFYASTGLNFGFLFVYFIFSLLLVFLANFFDVRVKMPVLSEKGRVKILVVLSLLSLFYFISVHGFSLNLNVFALEDVYEVREAAREERSQFGRYFYSWSTKLILPLTIVWGMLRRNYLLVFLGLLGMLYLFATSAHKSVIFSVVLLLAFSGEAGFRKKSLLFLYGAVLMVAVSMAIFLFFEFDVVQSLFIRRMLVLPAILNEYYFRVYAEVPAYYAHSFLSGIVENRYYDTPPYVVGLEYFGSEIISANNGFASDGYANLGWFGAAFQSAVLAFVLSFLATRPISSKYFGFLFIYVYQLNTSALFTTLLHHGLLLLCVVAVYGFLAEGGARKRFRIRRS